MPVGQSWGPHSTPYHTQDSPTQNHCTAQHSTGSRFRNRHPVDVTVSFHAAWPLTTQTTGTSKVKTWSSRSSSRLARVVARGHMYKTGLTHACASRLGLERPCGGTPSRSKACTALRVVTSPRGQNTNVLPAWSVLLNRRRLAQDPGAKDCVSLSLERGEGGERERERNIHQLPLTHPNQETRPTPQECACWGFEPSVCRGGTQPTH